MKYPEEANPWRWKADYWLPGDEGRGLWGGMGYLMGRGYSSEVMKSLETRESRCLHNIGNALNATSLYTLKQFTVRYVSFSSIKRKNKYRKCREDILKKQQNPNPCR